MRLYLIRHGMTKGNEEKRYVGTTDEALTSEAEQLLRVFVDAKKEMLGQVELVIASPMLRCRQTAGILFPDRTIRLEPGFSECDFGRFEYHNYSELNGNPDYQRFIDTAGKSGFPGGEDPEAFRLRCRRAFEGWLPALFHVRTAALVVHGGTIMSVMEAYAVPHRPYYDWQVRNGSGYVTELTVEEGKTGKSCRIEVLSEFELGAVGNEFV